MRTSGNRVHDGQTQQSDQASASLAPWKRKRPHEAFEGDVAIAELRSRLALMPEQICEPPASPRPATGALKVARFVMAATAVGVIASYLWEMKLSAKMADLTAGRAFTQVPTATLASSRDFERQPATRPAIGSAPSDTRGTSNPTTLRLSHKLQPEPATRPTIGFVPSDTPATSDPAAPIDAPEQSGAAPTAPRLPAADGPSVVAAAKMRIGVELMTFGEVVAARVLFQRAAEAGDGAGAFALAETYDPLALEEARLRGKVTPNIALARTWYERARDLGSVEARDRISRLTQLPQ